MNDEQKPSNRQLPVSSLIDVPTPAEGSEIVMTLQWGGYYWRKESETYSVVRLLDMDKGTVHLQIFSNKFTSEPSTADIQNLQPAMLHIPLLREFVFSANLHHFETDILSMEDLEGYRTYFEEIGWSEDAITGYMNNLTHYSTQEPLKIKLIYSSGEIHNQMMEQ